MDSNKVFSNLKTILKAYESALTVVQDTNVNFYLNTPISERNKKEEFFAAVQIKKSYVAFHLMPVYYYPELLNEISDSLKNKMQGKSCFNFKVTDDPLFGELSLLTKNAFSKYESLEKV